MRKVYYIYNPRTRTYDRIYPTLRQKAMSYLRNLFVGMGLGAGFFLILLLVFGSPSEKDLRTENSQLTSQYHILSSRLDDALEVMRQLQQRDDNLYRVIMQTDPVSGGLRRPNYAQTARYEELKSKSNSRLIVDTMEKLDALERELYMQSKSFDEVVELCKQNEEMLECIPAIQPVANKDLKQTASGYGMRIDPIYKTAKFHSGMDFSANKGTPVYATGNGVVIKSGWEGLYGNCIIVDHGFGYQTKYAHLSKMDVKRGQKVVRGQTIGRVGSTGKSTGPHLHYEVHVNGRIVNPVNYYFMDLSADDYERITEIASNQGKVFD